MPLSDIQRDVASLVLSLPEAADFALAGGAALIFYGVVDRPTRDLDCFGPSLEAVDRLVPTAVAALRDAGFEVELEHADSGFARLLVAAQGNETQRDLGFDPAGLEATPTAIGAVRALADLAGDKLLALFSRAAPRDFVDVAGLLRTFSREELLSLAEAKDNGFDHAVLAEAFGVLLSIRRERFDVTDDEYADMCSIFAIWRAELTE